jgi:hypothetical protein
LVAVDNVNYVAAEIVDIALDVICDNIDANNVLLHGEPGHSGSPTIALRCIAKFTDWIAGLGIEGADAAFRTEYPAYIAAQTMVEYGRMAVTA